MNKTLVFDMDGTIADLYAQKEWLKRIRNYDVSPYANADPLYDMDSLKMILEALKVFGWKVAIISWLMKDSTPDFDNEVRKAKTEWLNRYGFPYDEIHLVKYGTTKANCTRKNGGFQVLVDDNEKIRNGWHLGDTINANENIIEILLKMLDKEINE